MTKNYSFAMQNDIMYKRYVKQKIQEGLQAAKDGNTIAHSHVKKQLLNRERREN